MVPLEQTLGDFSNNSVGLIIIIIIIIFYISNAKLTCVNCY